MDWLQFLTNVSLPLNGALVGFILWVRYDTNQRLDKNHELVMKEVDRRMNNVEQEIKNHLQLNQQNTNSMLERIKDSIDKNIQNQTNFQLDIIRSYTLKTDTKDSMEALKLAMKEIEQRLIASIGRLETSAKQAWESRQHKGENNE